MTVSRDLTCDSRGSLDEAADDTGRARAIAALDDLTPRRSPDEPVRLVRPAPALTSRDAGGWVRRSVAAVRHALADGSLHHHSVPADETPAQRDGRRTPAVEVVRAWAAGHGLEAQRRCCPTCAAETVTAGR